MRTTCLVSRQVAGWSVRRVGGERGNEGRASGRADVCVRKRVCGASAVGSTLYVVGAKRRGEERRESGEREGPMRGCGKGEDLTNRRA